MITSIAQSSCDVGQRSPFGRGRFVPLSSSQSKKGASTACPRARYQAEGVAHDSACSALVLSDPGTPRGVSVRPDSRAKIDVASMCCTRRGSTSACLEVECDRRDHVGCRHVRFVLLRGMISVMFDVAKAIVVQALVHKTQSGSARFDAKMFQRARGNGWKRPERLRTASAKTSGGRTWVRVGFRREAVGGCSCRYFWYSERGPCEHMAAKAPHATLGPQPSSERSSICS